MLHTNKVGGFRQFLRAKVSGYTNLVEGFQKSMEEDAEATKKYNQLTFGAEVHWLSWHAVSLAAQVVAANEAALMLHQLKGMDDEAEVPGDFASRVLEKAFRTTNLNSRSSSASANLLEDASLAFWNEVAGVLFRR